VHTAVLMLKIKPKTLKNGLKQALFDLATAFAGI
jgi:hypothetical protein